MEISVARKRLEEMRADLDKTLSVLAGEHHLVRGGGAEAGDAGANLTESDRNAASMQAALAQRAEVLAALSRIDNGSYGRCVDCAGPVPEPRLEARPATARCVPCQSKRDRRRRLWEALRPSQRLRQQPPGRNLSPRGAPGFLRCPPQGADDPPRLTAHAISCAPTESSERACSSAFTSSPKLAGSRASR